MDDGQHFRCVEASARISVKRREVAAAATDAPWTVADIIRRFHTLTIIDPAVADMPVTVRLDSGGVPVAVEFVDVLTTNRVVITGRRD